MLKRALKMMDTKAELLKITASIVRMEGMPSPFAENWPKRMTKKRKEEIGKAAMDQCQLWGSKIKLVTDELLKQSISASTELPVIINTSQEGLLKIIFNYFHNILKIFIG